MKIFKSQKGGKRECIQTLHGREALQPLHDIVEGLHDFQVALDQAGGVVWNIVLLAKRLHTAGCLSQAAARHGWEQVVLNLKVETAH